MTLSHRHAWLALALAASPLTVEFSWAQTVYIVDDDGGPGVDFTTIQPAIDLAVAADRIEVRAGDYSIAPAVIDHAVTIMGAPGVLGVDLFVGGVQGTRPVVLVDLSSRVSVVDCSAPVLLDNSGITGPNSILLDGGHWISNSSDVRIVGWSLSGAGSPSATLSVVDSTVFFRDIDVKGWELGPGDGLEVRGDSAVTITDSSIKGRRGFDSGDCLGTNYFDGGRGLSASGNASVRLLRSQLFGGDADFNPFGCSYSEAGQALEIFGSATVVSDGEFSGPGVQEISPLPVLSLTGPFTVGSLAEIKFQAAPGSSARIFLGRRPVLTSIGGSAIPLAHSAERGVSLGSSPGTGLYSLPFAIPSLPRGTVIHLQASRTLTGGATEFTNPAMIIVR